MRRARLRPCPVGRSVASRALRRADGANLQIEKVPPGQTDFLLDMMSDFNALEGLPWSRERTSSNLRFTSSFLHQPRRRLLHPRGWGGAGVFRSDVGIRPRVEREGCVSHGALHPGAVRGRGLGRRVLLQIEELAERRGAKALHLMVRPENEPAVSLYQGAGYESPRGSFSRKRCPVACRDSIGGPRLPTRSRRCASLGLSGGAIEPRRVEKADQPSLRADERIDRLTRSVIASASGCCVLDSSSRFGGCPPGWSPARRSSGHRFLRRFDDGKHKKSNRGEIEHERLETARHRLDFGARSRRELPGRPGEGPRSVAERGHWRLPPHARGAR